MPWSSWIIQTYLSHFKCKWIAYTARKDDFSNSLNEKEAKVNLTNSYNLEPQETYNNITSRLSTKFSNFWKV